MIAIATFACVVSCDDYDDSDVKSDIADLQERVTALETLCSSLNSQISAIQSTVAAIESSLYVTDVSSIVSDGVVTGYIITFSDGSTITLNNGTDGTSGTDGTTPVIGVLLIDGVYYWTLNGSPIADSNGNMIPASGTSVDYSDYVAPQLKVEDDYWWVSYDGGSTWEKLSSASSDDAVDYITALSEDDDYVYITLYDGTTLTLAKDVKLEITFNLPVIGISEAGESIDITYTITGYDDETVVKALANDGYSVSVSSSVVSNGTITITAPTDFVSSEVLVLVSNSTKTILRVITIKTDGFIAVTNSSVTVDSSAGEVLVPLITNLDYTVNIPSTAADWLSYTETRAFDTDTLVFTVTANASTTDRYTTVTISSTDGSVVEAVLITQEGYTPELNDDWSVEYLGKWTQNGTYYDWITYTDGDNSRYINAIYYATYIDAVSVDSLFNYQQNLIDYYIYYYDSYAGYGDGYYISNLSKTSSGTYGYSGLSSEYEYYALMFGVDTDGALTGTYQISEKFTPQTVEASDAYNAWLGTWSYTDNNSVTGTLTFTEKEAEISMYMVQNEVYPEVEVSYNSSDGTITVEGYNTGYTGTDTTYGLGDYTVYWWATAYVSSASTSYTVSGTGYDMATIEMDSDGTSGTVTGLSIALSVGTGTVTGMGYRLYFSDLSYVTTWVNAPVIYLPATLTLSSSSTSSTAVSTSRKTGVGTYSSTDDTPCILEVDQSLYDANGFRYVLKD